MPTYGKGFLARSGFKKAATWGTPILIGAGYGLEFTTESFAPDVKLIVDNQVSGKATRLFGDKGNELHNGDIAMEFKYEGIESLFAQALGTAGTPAQVGTDNAYRHVLKVADSKEGIFGTLAIDKGVALWEWPSVKLAHATVTCKSGGRAEAKFHGIASSLNFNTGAGTNNQTTIASVTLPANRDFLLFSQMKVLINNNSAGALAGGTDDIYVNSFEFAIDNKMPEDDATTQFAPLIDEPVQDGFTEVIGTINLSKYQSGAIQTLVTQLLDKTRKKMRVQWTGKAIGATNFQVTAYFPDVQFTTGDASIGGPGRIPLNLKFEGHRVTTLPTGFPTGYTEAITMEIINQRNTDALS